MHWDEFITEESRGVRVFQVLQKAKELHSDQTRDAGEPYWKHLERVAQLLFEHGIRNYQILAAGILHDAIEDTWWSFSDVKSAYGATVAEYVKWCSIDTRKTRAEREGEVIAHAFEMPFDAALIKLADMIDNLRDMKGWNTKRRVKYDKEKQRLIAAMILGGFPADHSLAQLASKMSVSIMAEETV